MARSREPPKAADEQLAAPRRAVEAVTRAVVDRPDRGPRLAVLGEAGREVGVVVLHAQMLDAVALQRVARRRVVGVEVVDHELGS